ncbi:MAG: NAD-dependent epimerase [Candidatus Anoxymicrobium japonicum]|uniref:UDP-glucose 4-epimerase n=1 Tax=Candidatus Anoxymicrobium japonicum TaxID=2013648 RepID=A0A2N3G6R4_9ACTN|nr:MAG: NAD-dependent epimerase [Candidatus Anoxymicrobium japonicum]
MRAVVIGGNGFIGSHLVDALLADRWQITVYDRAPERYRPPMPGVEYVQGELGNAGLLGTVLDGGDVLFHLASTTIPESSNDAPIFDIQSNLVDTVRLLDVCVARHVKKVIFLSSGGTVYGTPNALPVTEAAPTHPICSYGIVKLTIEKYLQLYKHLHDLSYTILRPSNPYGPRQNPVGHQGVVGVFLGRIAQELPISVWGDGEIIRDYLHVTDLVRACLAAATTETTGPIFNIASGQGTSLNQLLEVIERVIGRPPRIVRLPARPFDVPRLVLDSKRAQRALRWQPQIPLEEGILDTWNWVRDLQWLHRVP